jgi:hypothetical protein
MTRLEALRLIHSTMVRENLTIEELPDDLKQLMHLCKPPRHHGPSYPRRGIGVHTNADLFRGF